MVKYQRILITGGAGCIGSTLASQLIKEGCDVVTIDNLSSGKTEHIDSLMSNKKFSFIKGDLKDQEFVKENIKNVDIVFHMSANPDIKFKQGDPTNKDLKENTLVTYNILEAMRINNIKKIVFPSSSAVYGRVQKIPIPENHPLLPISLYGASKAACESLISSFCHLFSLQAWIFRFANIIGGKSRKTGTTVLTDFIRKLEQNPNELTILGDGCQKKCYLTNEDCVDGMLFALEKANDEVNIFNLGPNDYITVNEIAQIVAKKMKLNPKFKYTGTTQGWPGDMPVSFLDVSKINQLGWKANHTSAQAIEIATEQLLVSEGV